MTVLGVMLLESDLVHVKVHVFTAWVLGCEESIAVAIIYNYEPALKVFSDKFFCDGSFIEPYLTIPLYIGFVGSLNRSIISFECHGIICCPRSCENILVEKEVGSGFISDYQNVSKV